MLESLFDLLIQEYFPLVSEFVFRSLVIFSITLGIVYILGRMLGIANSYRSRNSIALISLVFLAYWSATMYDADKLSHPHEIYWITLIYVALGAIFYVLIGFDLYDRFNAWLDKRFEKAKQRKEKKRK